MRFSLKKSQPPETDFYKTYERLELLMDATNDRMWDWDIKNNTFLAELISQAIHNLQIPHSQSLVSNYLTVSLGVACTIPNAQFSPQNLINVADQSLYTAKQQGRDRVVFSEINYASFCDR